MFFNKTHNNSIQKLQQLEFFPFLSSPKKRRKKKKEGKELSLLETRSDNLASSVAASLAFFPVDSRFSTVFELHY